MGRAIEDLSAPKFPMGKGPRGYVAMSEGTEVIDENIRQILRTEPGERVMRPEFGCALEDLLFGPNDEGTRGEAQHRVKTAVERWEPRVAVVEVKATSDEEKLHIQLRYRQRSGREVKTLEFDREPRG